MQEDELDEVKFEGLPWEVVCYEKALKKLNSKDMPRDLKKKTFNIIKLLASGERRRKDFRQVCTSREKSKNDGMHSVVNLDLRYYDRVACA